MSQVNKIKRTQIGRVISNEMDKTINVSIERRVKHPRYGKYLTLTKKLLAHDPENQCNKGDKVLIQESSPFSKRKAWCLSKVLEASLVQRSVDKEIA